MSFMKCGLKKDPDDSRDVCLMPLHYEKVDLPKQFSLRDKIKNVFQQGNMNSCSANAVSKQISIAGKLDYDISRLFIYYNSRLVENEYNKRCIRDEGCNLRNVMKALMKFNFLDERYYPYDERNVNNQPAEEYYKIADSNEKYICQYKKIIPDIYNMKYILNVLKLPIVCGVAVYDSFDKCNGGDYTVPNITPYDRLIGYHAVLITGYTEDKFEVLNSYGPFFGDRGYFYLTNEWVLNNSLCFDMWIIESN